MTQYDFQTVDVKISDEDLRINALKPGLTGTTTETQGLPDECPDTTNCCHVELPPEPDEQRWWQLLLARWRRVTGI